MEHHKQLTKLGLSVLGLGICAIAGNTCQAAEQGPLPGLSPPAKDARLIPHSKAEEKLDAALLGLVHTRAEGCGKAMQDFVKKNGLTVEDGKIRVQIIASSKPAVAKLKKRVKASGGTLITDLENTLFAWMPVEAIDKFAGFDEVWTMSVPQNLVGPQTGQPESTGVTQPAPVEKR